MISQSLTCYATTHHNGKFASSNHFLRTAMGLTQLAWLTASSPTITNFSTTPSATQTSINYPETDCFRILIPNPPDHCPMCYFHVTPIQLPISAPFTIVSSTVLVTVKQIRHITVLPNGIETASISMTTLASNLSTITTPPPSTTWSSFGTIL
jgi:hypothetical protein